MNFIWMIPKAQMQTVGDKTVISGLKRWSVLKVTGYYLIRRVQSVQNAAARYTRPYLANFAALHWLPVQRRGGVDYKLACFVFSSLSVVTHLRTSPTTYICLRRSSTAAALFHRQIVCRSTHTQHIRRQELRCRRATCLEQSSGPFAR